MLEDLERETFVLRNRLGFVGNTGRRHDVRRMITEVSHEHRRLGGGKTATNPFSQLPYLALLLRQECHPSHILPRAVVAAIGGELVAAQNRPLRHGLRDLDR